MSTEFRLPDLGEGIHEAEVLAISIREGDLVKEDQPIFEVETDKAVVEIPSPFAGKVQKIHVKSGQIVTVGSVMVTFETAAVPAVAEPRKGESTKSPVTAPVTAQGVPAGAPAPNLVQPSQGNGRAANLAADCLRPVPATPATRRLARDLGIDLHLIKGSGPGGRVLKEDVRSFAAGSLESTMSVNPLALSSTGGHDAGKISSSSLATKYGESGGPAAEPFGQLSMNADTELPDFSKYGPIQRVALRSIRRKTALNMARSWAHVPHVTHCDEADVTQLDAFRSKYEKEMRNRGGRLTLTIFALKAVASALKKYPQFNASLDERSGELIFKEYYNIGVAVATERGLLVPVIRNVDKRSITELAQELNEISEKTRQGKIELERLQGGTFTLTNIGAIGGTSMSPMVNYPECAILGMARAQQKPVVREGRIEVGVIMPLALSFDHRIADGAEAAYFVQHIVQRLQDPLSFLLDS